MTSATESGDHHKAFFVKTFSLIIFVFIFSASILTFILLVAPSFLIIPFKSNYCLTFN
jgi:hypothetical protein